MKKLLSFFGFRKKSLTVTATMGKKTKRITGVKKVRLKGSKESGLCLVATQKKGKTYLPLQHYQLVEVYGGGYVPKLKFSDEETRTEDSF